MYFLKKNLNNIILNSILIFTTYLLFVPLSFDPDLWWHLKLGEQLLKTQSLLNNLTYTCTNYIWINHSYFSDIIMYSTYSAFGNIGLSVLTSIIFLIGLFINYNTLKYSLKLELNIYLNNKFILILYIISNYFLIHDFVYARPQIISFLFLSLILNLLIKRQYNYKYKVLHFVLFFLISLLWVNLHGSFIIGMAVIFFFLFYSFLNFTFFSVYYNKEKLIKLLDKLKNYLLVLFLSIVATLINPFGINAWKEAISNIFSTTNSDFINEWRTINFHSFDYKLYLVIFFTTITLIIYNKKKNLLRIILLLIFIAFSFFYVRYILLSSIVITYIGIFELISLNQNLKTHKEYVELNLFFLISKIVVLTLIFSLTVLNVLKFVPVIFSQRPIQVEAGDYKLSKNLNYPYSAVEFIKKNKEYLNYKFFNDYGWGGYLEYTLPEIKWFIDGRMSNWACKDKANDYILNNYISITSIQENWMDLIDKYRIQIFVIKKATPLSNALKYQNKWENVYSDDVSEIFVIK